jgi:transcriptional regulator with XRE-family HTH domain
MSNTDGSDGDLKRKSLRLVHARSSDESNTLGRPSSERSLAASSSSPSQGEDSVPLTLATRMQVWREKRMLTQATLAIKALIPIRLVEDIESGIELFLSPAIRQRLARVLQVRPDQIKALEKTPLPSIDAAMQAAGGSLYQAILANPEAPKTCPRCGEALTIRLFNRRDLQNRPLTAVKASCTQCLFRLTDD